MKRNRQEWIDAVRDALRDAEAAPPAGGWARLAEALTGADAARGGARGLAAGAAVSRLRLYGRRVASVAAAVAVVAAGGYLWWAAGRLPGSGLPVADPVAGVLDREDDKAPLVAEATAEPGGEGTFCRSLSPAGPAGLVGSARSAEAADDRLRIGSAEAEESGGESVAVEPAAVAEGESADGRETVAEANERVAARPAVARGGRSGDRAGGRSGGAMKRVTAAVPERRTSLAVHAAGLPNASRGGGYLPPMSDAEASSGPAVLFAHAPADVMGNVVRSKVRAPRPTDYRHLQPVSVGLAVRYGFPHGLSLASGVNYTLLRSEARIEGRGGRIDQRLHFVGIPLRLDWQYLERGRFSLYIGAGGQVEKCVAARIDGLSVSEPGVQWSLAAAAGAQCGLGGVVALYAEPEVAWYVNATRLATSRTDHPLTFTLRLGVRFSF